MNDDFAPFELAVKLKEKGYPQRTFGEYDMQGACYIEDGRFYENGCITEVARAYTAPTISQVLKWLREEKKIHISIDIWGRTWGYDVLDLPSGNSLHWDAYNENINSYEQAALAGIEYALNNLI